MFHVPTRMRRISLGRAGVGVDGGLAALDGLGGAMDGLASVVSNLLPSGRGGVALASETSLGLGLG